MKYRLETLSVKESDISAGIILPKTSVVYRCRQVHLPDESIEYEFLYSYYPEIGSIDGYSEKRNILVMMPGDEIDFADDEEPMFLCLLKLPDGSEGIIYQI